jgi:hypothetical protein
MAAQHDVFQNRHVREKADVLKGPGQTPLRDGIYLQPIDPLSFFAGRVDKDVAFCGAVQAGDSVEKGCFACAVGADEADDIPLPHL